MTTKQLHFFDKVASTYENVQIDADATMVMRHDVPGAIAIFGWEKGQEASVRMWLIDEEGDVVIEGGAEPDA